MTDVVNRSSADESEDKQRTMSLTENSPTSAGIESEYDTASTNSRSENERDEYEDSEEDSLDDEEATDDEDGQVDDDERESGDGQEEQESEGSAKKKVDHDEDRSNPQYIPKKGTFYEHDDRTAEDIDTNELAESTENIQNSTEGLAGTGKVLSTQNQKVPPKLVKKTKDTDRWTHDRFNEYEQAPKSRAELVSAYGYDIRNEDCAPRPRRQRRYGRHQSKYDRKWEDEEAYKKTQSAKPLNRRSLRPEDFPALGASKASSTTSSKSPRQRSRRSTHQDENDPQSSSTIYRSPVRRDREMKSRDDRGSRDQRSQRYNNDQSNNNNNARHVKGKKNINFNHNIEFKNQNRKNINYDSTQTKNNNVLNQQMQSSQSSQHQQHSQHSHSSSHGSSHHQQHPQHQPQQHQSNQQRYNNNEAPLPTLSFTNSKMNNATNSSNATPTSSRTILNFDNSSGNYGRTSREKEVNSQQHQQMQHSQQGITNQPSGMSPNKNIQYTEHQIDQMKLMEKNYQQQQGKATNLNLNQVSQQQQQQQQQHQQINNMQDSSEMTRSKRYSSLRQRSNLNEGPTQQTQNQPPPQQQQQQQQPPPQQYHPQYHQQEIDPTLVQSVMPTQTPAYIPQQPQQQPPPPQQAAAPPPANMLASQQQQQQQANANVQQQAQKYQAAYYAANPASEYAAAQQAALMQAAMVEKYQYQQQTTPAQYLPPQQAQQIYMPTQTQPTQQQQILNYVSTIQPTGPAGAPAYPQYTNYQNYNIQAPAPTAVPPQQQPPPPAQTTPQAIYQTQSGLTYFPNTQMPPAHTQRIIQPQRRPNPIPILAPPDHKAKSNSSADDNEKNADDKGAASSAENIDHILDNMFVQRPMTNVVSLKDPSSVSASDDKNDDQINDGMNTMSISDDKKGGSEGNK